VVEAGAFAALGVLGALDVFAAPVVFVVEAVFVVSGFLAVLVYDDDAGGLVVVCACVFANVGAQRTPKLPASISAPAVP
jgi:hypothetical protein